MSARVLPHNVAAEASILGGILLRNEVLARLPDLEPGMFYDLRHRAIFEAMRNLEAAPTAIDVVTLEVALAGQGKLDAIGGPAYLGELTLIVPIVENVVAYAEIVTGLARSREVMLVASEIAERGYDDGLEDPAEFVSQAEAKILAVARRGASEKPRNIGEIAKARIRQLEGIALARDAGGPTITGVPTGIAVLDRLLGGYPRKVPTVIGARPKMGKSSLGMAAADAATSAKIGAIVFSLEDGWEAYADGVLARGSGVPTERLRSVDLQRGDLGPLAKAVHDLRARDNWRFDERVLDAATICRELRRAKAEIPNFGLGIVDYIQLVRRSRAGMSEHEALQENNAYFAAIAKELDIALLLVSQLNRKVEERDDKRPNLADLRGSGSTEEIGKLVLFLYRGAAYYSAPKKEIDYDCDCMTGATWCNHRPDTEDFEATIQVIIAANNQGRTGRVFANWRGELKLIS